MRGRLIKAGRRGVTWLVAGIMLDASMSILFFGDDMSPSSCRSVDLLTYAYVACINNISDSIKIYCEIVSTLPHVWLN